MKSTRNAFRYLRIAVQNLADGYHHWGRLRLILITAIGIGLSMIWGAVLERDSLMIAVRDLKATQSSLNWIPDLLLTLLLTPFRWSSLRYFIVPILTFFLALLLNARYLQDIYHLSTLNPSFRYLIACLFSFAYPTMEIGSSDKPAPDPTYLTEIGGPGFINIAASYAVVVSRPQATSNIYGEGKHFLLRGEKVEEYIDLNDQTDSIEVLSAFSHEGVAIRITDILFGYRIKQSPPPEYILFSGKELRPSPFSVHSIRNLMQSRVVTEQGLTEWRTMVRGMIRSIISDFIYRHTVVELLKPPADYNPYADLKKAFQSRPIRAQFRKMGTELLWINVGLFDLDQEVYKQELLKIWQVQSSPQQNQSSETERQEVLHSNQVGYAQALLIENILEKWEQSSPELEAPERLRLVLSAISASATNTDQPNNSRDTEG